MCVKTYYNLQQTMTIPVKVRFAFLLDRNIHCLLIIIMPFENIIRLLSCHICLTILDFLQHFLLQTLLYLRISWYHSIALIHLLVGFVDLIIGFLVDKCNFFTKNTCWRKSPQQILLNRNNSKSYIYQRI